jgi:hypothetical protein
MGSTGTASFVGNGDDPVTINGYYRTTSSPNFTPQTGTLQTYNVVAAGVLPRTDLDNKTVLISIGIGILLIIAGIQLRKLKTDEK